MSTLRKHARIGILHFMVFPEAAGGEGPIPETLKTILVDDYFDLVEVTRMRDANVAKEAAKMLEQSHMTVTFGAQPVLLGNKLNLNALDSGERRKAIDAVRACFDQAAMFHAVNVAVLSGTWEPGQEQAALDALAESLIELATEASEYGLKLALEMFDDAIDKKSLVGKAGVAKAIGKRVLAECPNFGLLHDHAHMVLLGEPLRETLEPVKDMLVHMHMGNAIMRDRNQIGYGDQHPPFGVPGGENDVDQLEEFLRVLYEIGYLGGAERRLLSFEIKPLPGDDSHLVIANAKRTLNEAALRLE